MHEGLPLKLLFLFVFFLLDCHANPPSWFLENATPVNQYEIIGYGSGEKLFEAKERAKNDVALTLSTHIQSSISISEYSNINDHMRAEVNQTINSSSDLILSDVQVTRKSFANGMYYVAVKYVNLPFYKKIKNELGVNYKNLQKEENPYLLQTFLLNNLHNEFGFFPKIKIYENNLIISNKSFSLNKTYYSQLFTNVNSKKIILSFPSNLNSGDNYFINTSVNDGGYLSLFQVYDSGETLLLLENQHVEKSDKIQYPDKKFYEGLQAYDESSEDLTIALLCKEKKDLSSFTLMENQNTKTTLFNEILNLMSECAYATKKLNIKKEQ